jgi:hypothetical protein
MKTAYRRSNQIIIIVLFSLITFQSNAQLFIGGGIGSFNKKLGCRGIGPTIGLLYSKDFLEETSFFFNTSLYNTNGLQFGTVDVYDNSGNKIGVADKSVNISKTHYQLGFLVNLGKQENAPRPNFFCGAGLVLSIAKATYNYNLQGQTIPSESSGRSIFGFNFDAGINCKLKKLVIELKGSFDFMLKQDISELENDLALPHVSSTRLSFYYPLTK